MARGKVVFLIMMLGLSSACGDDDGPGGSGAGGAEGGGGAATGGHGGSGAGGEAANDSLTITVVDVNGGSEPMSDVACAWLAPGGQVLEATTDADGQVTFEGFDWALGPASVTCVQDKQALSAVGLTSADAMDGELVLNFYTAPPTVETVSVSGTSLNREDPEDRLLVGSSVGPSIFQEDATSFSVEVAKGVPFSLIALEFSVLPNPPPHSLGQDFLGWVVKSSPALDNDTTIDLDFAVTTPSTTASGSVKLPNEGPGVFDAVGAYPYLYVTKRDPFASTYLGFATRIGYDEDAGTVVYDAEFVDTPVPDEEALTVMFLASSSSTSAEYSYLYLLGHPKDGDLDEQFLDPPRSTQPSGAAVSIQGATVAWDPEGPRANDLSVTDETGSARWFFTFYGSASEVVIPPLPSSTPVEDFFTGDSLTGRLAISELMEDPRFYHRYASTKPIRFKP